MSPDEIDAYAILGVAPDASAAELKAAHRRLVRRHHPDLAAPEERARATRRVQEINVAYGLVRDPSTRAAYDRLHGGTRGLRRARRDRDAAAAWDRLVAEAGRWAGRWWRLNRGRARRAAVRTALRARRGTVEIVTRVQMLALGLTGALLGFAGAVGAGRLLGVPALAAQLVGIGAGCWAGTARGGRRRLRALGLPEPRSPAWVAPLAAIVAIAAALALDVALG